MKIPKNYEAVTTIAVAVSIIFYTVFNKHITPLIIEGFPEFGFLASLLASIGFYVFAFKFFIWVYFKWLEGKLNSKEAILGEWFYKLEIKGRTNDPRYGICQISRHNDEIIATGMHFDPSKNKFTSRFNADFVLIQGHTVMMIYSSFGVDEEIFSRKGVFFLSTEGSPPKRIYGVWTDVLPNKNSGEIMMQSRDNQTDNFLSSINYPLKKSEFQKIMAGQPQTQIPKTIHEK